MKKIERPKIHDLNFHLKKLEEKIKFKEAEKWICW